MAEAATAVAVRDGEDDGAESLQALIGVLEQRRAAAKSAEAHVARREAEVRRALEEQALLRELRAVNQLTLRKMNASAGAASAAPKLKISDESLAQVIALEDAIKLENKKSQELQAAADATAKRQDDVERSIAEHSTQVAVIKDTTGWDRHQYAARGFTNEENRFREHQRVLTALEEEQQTLKAVTTKLTAKIEALTAELERRKTLEEEFVRAQLTLKAKAAELAELEDKKRSLARITLRKEKMLNSMERADDYKTIRQLEGDKKVLHNDLARGAEVTSANSKAILAQEVRLRQLESKLAAVAAFLRTIFADVERSEDEHADGVAAAATTVTTAQLDAVHARLQQQRVTLEQRDERLLALDARVEQLERKLNIIDCAIVTRTAAAAQEEQEMRRDYGLLSEHVEYMRSEFDAEYGKLSAENEMLRARLGGRAPADGADAAAAAAAA